MIVLRKRPAYTYIELLMVIILIGILSAVAIPKLAATRNDAKLAVDITNMGQCIMDITSTYTAQGIYLTASDSQACSRVKCYTVTYPTDDTNLIVATNPNGADFCVNINEAGDHLAQTYIIKSIGLGY